MSFNQLVSTQPNSLAINNVLRKTYLLLSLTLLFSTFTAVLSMQSNAQPNFILFLVGMFGLQFLTIALKDSKWGIVAIFAFTGFMGYTLGPILHLFLHNFVNGMELITTALAATGLVFFGLSAYVLITRKSFNYLGGIIAVGIMVAFMVGIGAMLFQWPLAQLLVSGAFAVFSAGYILYTTSEVMQGGETNYIIATISLYVALFNLFTSLLRLLSAFTHKE